MKYTMIYKCILHASNSIKYLPLATIQVQWLDFQRHGCIWFLRRNESKRWDSLSKKNLKSMYLLWIYNSRKGSTKKRGIEETEKNIEHAPSCTDITSTMTLGL
ncbi:hypothetical protein PHYBLDRAFT_173026 [Phycomyces blakesleeanus NRRL 1555(-)]|uniref:Uncharacterized protein n=1 Tax=Phycomyces blakesleeanus (strain ATCC 8743b / DSM 1359 / FGSC 10004 / NBRC 33097 / NRRL 1555) TaxID=763407 RepID=A0A162WKF3_PHYB8|nr:hypothetical protein PHYBLDRAFT_173026 [Phycomyces blakesleeanus NRRL 1555(-)]OAD68605.1 hypothetical protein PHYBLDRAFT_173026 [Phycomyces blakesleeanus NRRL 1555(-)]|eukprot:XP_018286645.1 hypothetical protein PHYBLDRAFT_173026 [Phycomyces blakesleeanus NRRL 1555(-)]